MQLKGSLNRAASDLCLVGDSLYFYAAEWNDALKANTISYGIINVKTHQLVTDHLSSAPELANIEVPFGIIVNPKERDFYLMDAKNYVSSGRLHFKADGTFDWSVNTGDIPCQGVFVFQ